MTLDEAIQHCKEQVQEQAKKGCYSCAEEHQQLAEWLTELKEYREQRDGRMNESEKERLIKKDIESVENRVRHAFNQGYEMGKKSGSEIPNICGDAISRQAVMDYFRKWQPYMATRLWDFEQELLDLPSVTPQQRTGRWIEVIDETDSLGNKTWHHECSICGSDKSGWGTYKHCPDCGTKMEVKDAD